MEIPAWKQEVIIMDFITGLLRSHRKFDSIWVIIDRLTKSTCFLPVRTTYATEDYAKLYLKEIVRLHSIPVSIISDRGAQFMAKFWKSFQESLGTRVSLSTTFYPQSDGYHASIKIAPYEVLYSRKCRSPAELQAVHLVFHVSMLRKCIGDASKIVPVDDIQVTKNLTYEEEPMDILDRQIRRLRNKYVVSVKVLWRSKDREEMTWKEEAEMKSNYPHLFTAIDDTIPEDPCKILLYPQIIYKEISSALITRDTLLKTRKNLKNMITPQVSAVVSVDPGGFTWIYEIVCTYLMVTRF
ncbi:uncharacterized protein LOC132631056 [Lycium barbarum]|uniref:uncharacterized protein LOC132631056 n=1 Tax=Lycium barbarum TaxID=112863 RepID=UPI00293F00A7|nr:uncharacterized protein LOC132631056 [Lycium barbarum]